jgi:protein NirF
VSRVVGPDTAGTSHLLAVDADQIWIADLSDVAQPKLTKFTQIGRQPYDGLVTPDGRHYIAGLFGEDGLALIDLWDDKPQVRRILGGYGRGEEPLPVFKMPHLRGWAVAGRHAYLPAIGRHEVLVVDTETWAGRAHRRRRQPVFVMARPDGAGGSTAVPTSRVQVIDTGRARSCAPEPGKAVPPEFTRGEPCGSVARRQSGIGDRHQRYDAGALTSTPSGVFTSPGAWA